MEDRIQVGPHFVHIQEYYPKNKRKEFIEWCKKPGKRNTYMPQMPAMAHVSEEDLGKIHDYILSVQVRQIKTSGSKDAFPDTRRPRIVRSFFPNCGPAALLVALPTNNELNLVWDTELCRLRYLTTGEPDNYPYLRSNGNSFANPGKTAYVEDQVFVSKTPRQFNGYRIKDGLPTFFYLIDGVAIEEQIRVVDNSLVRTITSNTSLPQVEHKIKTGAAVQTTVNATEKSLTITHSLK